MNAIADVAGLLALFFTKYLMQQRQVSPHTVASYRDTFRLLVNYANRFSASRRRICPSRISTPTSSATSSIISSMSGATMSAPAMPVWPPSGPCSPMSPCMSRAMRPWPSGFWPYRPSAMSAERSTSSIARRLKLCCGRRIGPTGSDDATTACCWWRCRPGMRSSEIITLRLDDVRFGDGAHVRCHGKGRKDRCIPLRRDSVAALRGWLKERGGGPCDPVFPNQRSRPLTHDSLAYLLARNLAVARTACPSLAKKRVTPHTLRHSAAMELLHNGVDRATIALWLGHESVETTYIYLHADLKLKERAWPERRLRRRQ